MHYAHSATPTRGAGARQTRAYNGTGAAGTWQPPPPPPVTSVNGRPMAPGGKPLPKPTPYTRTVAQPYYTSPMRTHGAPQYLNAQGYQLHVASNAVPVGTRHASLPTPAQVVRSQRPRKPATYTRNPLRPRTVCQGCGFDHAPTPNCC